MGCGHSPHPIPLFSPYPTLPTQANHGDEEETKLAYIGMQGDHTHGQRMAVNATYELIATPNDDALFSHSHEHHLAPNAGGRPGM